MKTKHGKPDRPVTGGGYDVTGQKSLEVKLKESDQLFRSVFENANDVIYIIDSSGRFVSISPVFKQITGWDPKEWIGKSFEVGIHPEDRSRGVELFHAVLEGQKSSRIDLRVESKSGGYLDVEVNAVVLYQDGSPIVVGFVRDITERKRAEKSLRKSEERFRLIAERITEVFYLVDITNNKTLYVSPAFEAIWGMPPSEVEENPWNYMKPVHPEDLPRVKKDLESQQRGLPFDHEYRIIRPDGEMRWIWDRGYPVRNSDGTVDRYVGVAQDITERKNAESALLSSEERFRTLFEFAPDPYFLMDTDGTFVDGNASTELLTGYERRELMGKNLATAGFIDPADIPRALESFTQRLRGESVENNEYTVHRKSGDKILVDLRTIRMNVAGHDVVLGIARDITKRKKTENALKESEQFFESIVENIPHMIFVKDARDLKFVRLNRTAESIIGIPREELLGRSDYDFFPKHEADFFVESDRKVLQNKTILDIPEETLETRNGRRILHTKKISIQGLDGEPRFLLGISEDISERKEMEKRQKSLEAQLFRSQRLQSLGTLAGGIAHDFNNILGIILAYASIPDSTDMDEHRLSYSRDAIVKATKRGAGLVRQMLAFARQTDIRVEAVRISDSIDELTKLIQETFPKTIDVTTFVEPALPPISADANQIHQVLLNLSVNARDAMPKGGQLSISAKRISDESLRLRFPELMQPEYVQIDVSDTGTGMDEKTMKRIFEPFFTTKEVGKGTGLGLATVYGIVKSHQGLIDVESEVGHGTTFHMYFPTHAGPPEKYLLEKEPFEAVVGGQETILVVEDEEALRELVKGLLITKGYKVLAAKNGEEALEMFTRQQWEIDLVLTDIGLPKLSGEDLVRRIKSIDRKKAVIVASGYIDPQVMPELTSAGVKKFVQKPYVPRELLKKVREVLDVR